MKTKILLTVLFAALAFAGCTPTATAEPEAPEPTATSVPTDPPAPTSTSTAVPPTATEAPPTSTPTDVPPTATETPIPDPVVIGDATAADGCTLVALNPAAWAPLFTAYNAGSDPFFHIHTNDESFFVGLELYTVYGAGWTGQTGIFEPDCSANGLCVYLAPDGTSPYLATAGEIEITALSQTDGTLDYPVDLTLRNLTFDPVPGSGGAGCYHVDEFQLTVEE